MSEQKASPLAIVVAIIVLLVVLYVTYALTFKTPPVEESNEMMMQMEGPMGSGEGPLMPPGAMENVPVDENVESAEEQSERAPGGE